MTPRTIIGVRSWASSHAQARLPARVGGDVRAGQRGGMRREERIEISSVCSGGAHAGRSDSMMMVVDDLAGAVFALAAAVRYRQVGLDGVQRIGATIHNFANLAIADPIAEADVHLRLSPLLRGRDI